MELELSKVEKRFGPMTALKGVSLRIPSGRRVALVGPNGSGKSTLLRAVMGMIEVEGEVKLDGRSPFSEREAIARKLAYVPQIAPQLGASVGEVVRAVADLRGLAADDVARLAARLELDVRAIKDRPFRNLSGGMKQKLLIALALASKPSLLILDEPTASLDARAREAFFKLVEEEAAGATMILCSHRLEEVRQLVQWVVGLEDGHLAFDGSVEQFLGERALSVVEVHVPETLHEGFLAESGFRAGQPGWWSRTVRQQDKLMVVAAVTERLGSAMQNLVVRDLEALEAPDGGARG